MKDKLNVIRVIQLLFVGLLFWWCTGAFSEDLYFIDAHSQADESISLEDVLSLMRQAGIKKTILSSRRKRKSFDIAEFAEAHPKEIIAAVRTKSGHYKRNKTKYYKKLEKQLNSGRFNAMAELLLYHAQKGELADEVVVYPDDERVTAALNGARENGWPFILHIEFAAMNSSQKQKYFNGLDKLLKQYPDHPFMLIHMGQLSASEVEKLIAKHSNIYFLTSHSNSIAIANSDQPWINMFNGESLAPEWKSLIIENPTRFVFAIDNVWPTQWHNGYREQVQLWRSALNKFPANVANAVAHENAERLWNLH